MKTQSWYIHIWPDDGSFEQKHAEILLLITIYIVVLLTGISYYVIAIYNGMDPINTNNKTYLNPQSPKSYYH